MDEKELLEKMILDSMGALVDGTERMDDKHGRVLDNSCYTNLDVAKKRFEGRVAFGFSGVLDIESFLVLKETYERLIKEFREKDKDPKQKFVPYNVYDIDMKEGEG